MKKVIAYVLVLCLVCFTAVAFFATDDTILTPDEIYMISPTDKSGLIEVLNFVELSKNDVGLGHVNFNEINIGQKIYSYSFLSSGFELLDFCYPIIYQNEVILLATPYGNGKFQIALVEDDYIKESCNKTISFIYDAVGCYIYDGKEFKLTLKSGYTIEEREVLSEYIDEFSISNSITTDKNNFFNLNSIILTDMSKSEKLGYVTYKN